MHSRAMLIAVTYCLTTSLYFLVDYTVLLKFPDLLVEISLQLGWDYLHIHTSSSWVTFSRSYTGFPRSCNNFLHYEKLLTHAQ